MGRSGQASHLLAVEAGIVVRERHPEKFRDVHVALFAARHDEGRDLRERAVVHDVLSAAGVDADEVMAVVADGGPRQVFRKAHEAAVSEHHIFGVPTFVVGDRAVFVRLMTRPDGDGDAGHGDGRARPRPRHRAPRAQRVQAHLDRPLTASGSRSRSRADAHAWARRPNSAWARSTSAGLP